MTPAPKQHDLEMGDAHSIATSSSHKSRSVAKTVMKIFNHKKRRSKGEHAPFATEDLKTAGTFDTATVTATTPSAAEEDFHYEHPRSKQRLSKKWAQIKDHAKVPFWREQLMAGNYDRIDGDPEEEDPNRRATLMKQAQERIRNSMEFSLWHCLVAIAIYVMATVYCYTFWLEPDWTIVDSIYFAVVTFTTIGYGDMVPDTRPARLFTALWALSGVASLGIALGVLGSQLVEVHEEEKKKQSHQHRSEMFDMFNIDNVPRQVRSTTDESTTTSNFSDLGSYDARDYPVQLFREDEQEEEQSSACQCSPRTIRFFWLTVFMAGILFFISQYEGWNPWQAFYYGLITACTVGYGDFAPKTQEGRLLALAYIPVAVAVIGSLLELISNAIISFRRERGQRKLRNKELTLDDLKVMDVDGDGTVTKAEFYEFMLVAMGSVDQDLIDNLKSHFDRLDKDKSGTLDKDDLINVAQFNLQKEKSSKRILV